MIKTSSSGFWFMFTLNCSLTPKSLIPLPVSFSYLVHDLENRNCVFKFLWFLFYCIEIWDRACP